MKKYCKVFFVVKTYEDYFYETSLFFKRRFKTATEEYFEMYKSCYNGYPLSYRNHRHAEFNVNNDIPNIYFILFATNVDGSKENSKFYVKVI